VLINDKGFVIVVRNATLLLVAILCPPDKALEVILHIGYSIFITKELFQLLQERIKPPINDVCEKIRHKPGISLQSKSWTADGRKLSLILQKSVRDELRAYLEVPAGLSKTKAQEIMVATTIAP
jgi:hypothetical protein